MRKRQMPLWVAVKIERGYVCEARLFESLDAAQKTERRWQARLNPDYDGAAVVKGHFTASLKRKLLASR